jgi:hypothetical protein
VAGHQEGDHSERRQAVEFLGVCFLLSTFGVWFQDSAMRMTRDKVLDIYFMEARAKLIDLAAFLDRVDRADGADDFRIKALRKALKELNHGKPERAKRVLLSLSDPTDKPVAAAATKAASGAWPGIK